MLSTSRNLQTIVCTASAMPVEDRQSPEALAQQLRTLLRDTHDADAAIVLPDMAARFFMTTPPRNAAHLADCAAAAGLRFQEIYGEPPLAWQLEADWNARHAFLTCALPRPLLGAVQQVAQEQRLNLISVVPQFVAAWNRWHASIAEPAWFATLHDNCLTLAAIEQQQLQAVRSLVLPAVALQDSRWLARHLEREALRLDLPTPKRLQLCGEVPEPWRRTNLSPATLHCEILDRGAAS